MTSRTIRILKPVVFLLCLIPVLLLLQRFHADSLGSDPVSTITHFTGNWAVYFLLLGLAISPVRRLSPKLGFLVRFRRMIGLFAFFYATLHLLTYVFLFSGFDLSGAFPALKAHDLRTLKQDWLAVWPTMVDDIKKRRFIQVGLIAWLILLALASTSPQVVLRRMGGRAWQWLHRLVYVAAFLAIVHYWWLVKPGNHEPLRDTLVLAILLLARPVWKFVQGRRTADQPGPVRA